MSKASSGRKSTSHHLLASHLPRRQQSILSHSTLILEPLANIVDFVCTLEWIEIFLGKVQLSTIQKHTLHRKATFSLSKSTLVVYRAFTFEIVITLFFKSPLKASLWVKTFCKSAEISQAQLTGKIPAIPRHLHSYYVKSELENHPQVPQQGDSVRSPRFFLQNWKA